MIRPCHQAGEAEGTVGRDQARWLIIAVVSAHRHRDADWRRSRHDRRFDNPRTRLEIDLAQVEILSNIKCDCRHRNQVVGGDILPELGPNISEAVGDPNRVGARSQPRYDEVAKSSGNARGGSV